MTNETSQQQADRMLQEYRLERRGHVVQHIDWSKCRADEYCRCHICKPAKSNLLNGWWIAPASALGVLFWLWVAWRIYSATYS